LLGGGWRNGLLLRGPPLDRSLGSRGGRSRRAGAGRGRRGSGRGAGAVGLAVRLRRVAHVLELLVHLVALLVGAAGGGRQRWRATRPGRRSPSDLALGRPCTRE